MPRYFLDLPEDDVPRPWDPHAGPRTERLDTRYFGGVLRAMEAALDDPEIDVYVTFDVDRLPAVGPRVVAVVLGDEAARIPRYTGQVRAVFKCYGTRPAHGAGPLRHPGLTGLADAAQWAVRWIRWLPGGAAHARLRLGRALTGRPGPPPIGVIPLGTFNQLDLPVVPMAERSADLFFAGSVEHAPSLRRRLLDPKTRARREMLAASERLARSRPGTRADLRTTPGFKASEAAPAEAYSRALMDARVCLAPRGTSVETFRVFEGLRYGCVVVADPLPPHRFYDGAPIVQLDRWSSLADVVGPLLDDADALDAWHARALRWWRERCSEEAVGRSIAACLNRRAAAPR